MAGIVTNSADAAATKCTEILIDKVLKELTYMCCYKSYAIDFEEEKEKLKAAVGAVNIKIKEAQKRIETQIDPIVEKWVEKANKLIQQETTPKKWFSRYSLAKKLERMTQEIPTMMGKAENFSQVAHAAERPGMEFYSQEFMPFKSRDPKFEQLRKDLKDGNKCRIGLQAMGGSGKTTMAKAIGKELENTKEFDKVIFIEVPNPVDEKKIQVEIEKKLDLKIDDDTKKNLTDAEQIWIRIANAGKVLIILDDVWKELNLENIGIQHGIHNKGRCCVLLTTRYEEVCKGMKCQNIINLENLPEEDAMDLFLYHASESGNDCTYKSKNLVLKIVNECGRLPVIIVAVAKTFRKWDPNEWEDAFAATKKDSSLRHGNIDEEVNKFYNSLKISFQHLDPRTQDLIFLCSIFPRAYEIPIELLTRIAIGLGLCENVDNYYTARSQVLLIKTTLVSSALLLPVGEGFVKMHDVIRDVAHQMADEKIQVIMDSKAKLEENAKYSSWMIDDFSNYFEGNNLEVLLVWVNAKKSLEVPNTIFRGMKGLRVLILCSKYEFGKTLALSLPKSIHSLENIQTLSLTKWHLGDISILRNLKELLSLELTDCSILELPNDVSQLKKLRLLRLAHCLIENNNPLEVIGRCRKLEVLYYVSNNVIYDIIAKPSKVIDLQEFKIYHIEGSSSFWPSFQLDASTKRYFNSTMLNGILSESTVKSLAARAEILELTKCNEIGWTSLIPDMVHPIKDGGMNDLIRLSLKSWPAMQCLINTNGIPSDATIFSNLVELQLHDMPVRELCHGDFPIDFLKQLEKLNLSDCHKLDDTLFKGKLELSNLKSVELNDCSMMCLFDLSTAQSLRQLENLYIRRCSKLKCLISDDEGAKQKVDDHQDPNQKNRHLMFLKLKILWVQECHELEFILPISQFNELESVKIDDCNELNYIFGQCPNEGGLYQMEKETILPLLQEIETANVPKFINIYPEYHLSQPSQVQKSRGPMCCFSSKAYAFNIDEQSFSKANQLDHTQASKEKDLSRVGGLFTRPLCPFKNLRKMSIQGFSELKSLLTLSVASSLKLLETLRVNECGMLEHIITDERPNSHGHMNVHSIFPNLHLVYVQSCNNLEYVFPAFYSKNFKDLEEVCINKAKRMKNMFGKCHADQDDNVQSKLNFPALKRLCLIDVQNMVSICAENYYVEMLHLESIACEGCPKLPEPFIDFLFGGHKREELSRRKALSFKERGKPLSNLRYVEPQNFLSFQNLKRLEFLGFKQLKFILTASTARSMPELRRLIILDCEELVSIIEDNKENQQNPFDPHHQACFPKLFYIQVKQCMNLKCLFSISTCPKLPRLLILEIEDAPELVQVFECKQGAPQELVIKDVFPNLLGIRLVNLPSFHTIYQGIDFQTLKVRLVRDCGNIPSANVNCLELSKFYASLREDHMNFIGSDYWHTTHIIFQWFRQITETSKNEIVEEQLPTSNAAATPSSKSNRDNLVHKESSSTHFELTISNLRTTASTKELCGKESKCDQEALGEGISLNEGHQRVKGPTNDLFTKETTKKVALELCEEESKGDQKALGECTSLNEGPRRVEVPTNDIVTKETTKKVALAIPHATTTKMTSPLDPSICTFKKPQITTSTTHIEPKISRSDLSDISITTECPQNLKATFGEGPSFEKYDQTSSSTYSKTKIEKPYTCTPSTELCGKESMDDQQALGESRSCKETPQRVEEPCNIECSSKDTSKERTFTIPPSITETTSPPISFICSPKKPENATSAAHVGIESGSSAIIDQYAHGQIMVNQRETSIEDDLTRLFRIMRDGSDMELSCVSNIDAFEDDKVAKAFSDIESSLKMDLNQIAISEEHTHRLENALNFLSTHFSEVETSSHSLVRRKIESIHQEIQRIISSFKQSSDTLDTLTKLKEKEKWIDEQHSQRLEAATTLVSEICNTEDYMNELKEQICRLQEELKSKEKEFEEYEIKLSSLQKQKKECVCETIEFMEEYEAVKKDKSYVGDGQTKARQEIKKLKNQWPSCVTDLRKTSFMLGILLKHKP